MMDLRPLCGHVDFCWVVLDSLRYDVACEALIQGRIPHLAALIGRWEPRHTPGNFTLSAHQAFFAGFLPTPIGPPPHPRNLALDFAGSTTVTAQTLLLEGDNLCEGLRRRGYHSCCIGGVGFFNGQTPLSRVLPGLFCESHWNPSMGVTHPDSTRNQVDLALRVLEDPRRLFLYLNVSATHQPTHFYGPGPSTESPQSQLEALAYADLQLARLWPVLRRRGAYCWVFADHGTTHGEDGYHGHRLSHPLVWTVPYAEFLLPARP
jgi:hypothetical protein